MRGIAIAKKERNAPYRPTLNAIQEASVGIQALPTVRVSRALREKEEEDRKAREQSLAAFKALTVKSKTGLEALRAREIRERQEREAEAARIAAEIAEKERKRAEEKERKQAQRTELTQAIGVAHSQKHKLQKFPVESFTASFNGDFIRGFDIDKGRAISDTPYLQYPKEERRQLVETHKSARQNKSILGETPMTPYTFEELMLRYEAEDWHSGQIARGLSEPADQRSYPEWDNLDDELLKLTALKTLINKNSDKEKISKEYANFSSEPLPEQYDTYAKIQGAISSINKEIPPTVQKSTQYMGYRHGSGRFGSPEWF